MSLLVARGYVIGAGNTVISFVDKSTNARIVNMFSCICLLFLVLLLSVNIDNNTGIVLYQIPFYLAGLYLYCRMFTTKYIPK